MMDNILNAKSENIEIFPISIDRNGNYYIRKSGYNKIEGFESLEDSNKEYLAAIGIATSIPNTLSNFYNYIEAPTSTKYLNGRALTEQNLSTIIDRLSNISSYVIDKGSGYIEFLIKGHYFKLTDSELVNKDQLYVGVNFSNMGNDFEMLYGYDEVSSGTTYYFKEVDFSVNQLYTHSNKPSGYTGTTYDYTLCLISDSKIPISSKFRFNGDVIRNIDGGTV